MFLDKGDPIQIIITDTFSVVKVKFLVESENSREEIGAELQNPENAPYKIYVNYYPDRRKVSVGDKLNSSLVGSLTLMKSLNGKELDRDFRLNRDETNRKNKLENYFKNISLEKVDSAENLVKSINEDLELFYRCFYNSFKMYRAKDCVVYAAKELLMLAGDSVSESETYEEIYLKLKDNEFSDVLIKSYEEVMGIDFSNNKNHPQLWYEDARGLFSGVQLFTKALEMFALFSRRVLKGNIFILENRMLEWDEAGAMEVFEPAVLMRYTRQATPEHDAYEQTLRTIAGLSKVTLKKTKKTNKGKK